MAILTFVRYEIQDEKGESRRERNDSFGETSPLLIIPPDGAYLWRHYWAISESVVRIQDGICRPIPPSEFNAWTAASGEVLYHHEYEILRAMDAAYCEEMNRELADFRDRQKAEQEKAMADAKRGKGKRGK